MVYLVSAFGFEGTFSTPLKGSCHFNFEGVGVVSCFFISKFIAVTGGFFSRKINAIAKTIMLIVNFIINNFISLQTQST